MPIHMHPLGKCAIVAAFDGRPGSISSLHCLCCGWDSLQLLSFCTRYKQHTGGCRMRVTVNLFGKNSANY